MTRDDQRPLITALIPAHNEADALPGTLAGLTAQHPAPDRIIVVSDNSTDATVEVARAAGVEVMETVGNTARKAGALNQGLARVDREGLVLVVDADTALSPGFLATALTHLQDPTVGAVGAVFTAPPPRGYLQLCQHLEWTRYAEAIGRTGKTFVLSGTAALIRWEALEDVRRTHGRWYDTTTITEDSRLTLDLKAAGWALRSPVACRAVTETMPTVTMLWKQRRRWYLGAMQNIRDAGITRVTLPYLGQQVMLAVSVMLMALLITLSVVAITTAGGYTPSLFWLGVGAVFATERVVTVWGEPWPRVVFAALVLPELVYAWVLQSAYLAATVQFLRGSRGVWAHVTPATAH